MKDLDAKLLNGWADTTSQGVSRGWKMAAIYGLYTVENTCLFVLWDGALMYLSDFNSVLDIGLVHVTYSCIF
jgi:hypothetical protein